MSHKLLFPIIFPAFHTMQCLKDPNRMLLVEFVQYEISYEVSDGLVIIQNRYIFLETKLGQIKRR